MMTKNESTVIGGQRRMQSEGETVTTVERFTATKSTSFDYADVEEGVNINDHKELVKILTLKSGNTIGGLVRVRKGESATGIGRNDEKISKEKDTGVGNQLIFGKNKNEMQEFAERGNKEKSEDVNIQCGSVSLNGRNFSAKSNQQSEVQVMELKKTKLDFEGSNAEQEDDGKKPYNQDARPQSKQEVAERNKNAQMKGDSKRAGDEAIIPTDEDRTLGTDIISPRKERKNKTRKKDKNENDCKTPSKNTQDPVMPLNEDWGIGIDVITTNKSNAKSEEDNRNKEKDVQEFRESTNKATLQTEVEGKLKEQEVIPGKENKQKSAEKKDKKKVDFKITFNNTQDPMMPQNEDCDKDVDIIRADKSNSKLEEENIIKEKNVQDFIEKINHMVWTSEEENKSKEKEVIPAKESKQKSGEKGKKKKNWKISPNNTQDPMMPQNEDCDINVDIITTGKSNSKLVEENIVKEKDAQNFKEKTSQTALPSEEEIKSKEKGVIPAKEIKQKNAEKKGKKKKNCKIPPNNTQDPMRPQNEDCNINVVIIRTDKSNSKLAEENIIKEKIAQDFTENINQTAWASEEENKSKQKEVMPAKEIKQKSAEKKKDKMKNDCKITSNNIQDLMIPQNEEDCDIDVNIVTTNKSNSKLVEEYVIKEKNVQDIIENINQATLSSGEENRLKEIGVITAKEIKQKSTEKKEKKMVDFKITSNNTQDPMMPQNEDWDIDVDVMPTNKSNSKPVDDNSKIEKDAKYPPKNICQAILSSEGENEPKETEVILSKKNEQKSAKKKAKKKNDHQTSSNNTQDPLMPQNEDWDIDIDIITTDKSTSKLVEGNIDKGEDAQDPRENINKATLSYIGENKPKGKGVILAKETGKETGKESKQKIGEKKAKKKKDCKTSSSKTRDLMIPQDEDWDIEIEITTPNTSRPAPVEINTNEKRHAQNPQENINKLTLLSEEENSTTEKEAIPGKEKKQKNKEKKAKKKKNSKTTFSKTEDPTISQNEDWDIDIEIITTDKSTSEPAEININSEKNDQDIKEKINQTALLSEEENKSKEKGVTPTKESKQKSAEKKDKRKKNCKISPNNFHDLMIPQNEEDCDIDVNIVTTNKSNSKLVEEYVIKEKNVQDIIENINQATLSSEEENKSKEKEVMPAKEIKRKITEKKEKKVEFKITSSNTQDQMMLQNEDCDIDIDIITTNKSNSEPAEVNGNKKKGAQDIRDKINQTALPSEVENKSKEKEVIPAKEIKRKSAEKMAKMKNDFKISPNNTQDPMIPQNEDCDIGVNIVTTNKSNSKLVKENIIKKKVQDIIENISQATLPSEVENKSKEKEVIPAKEIKRKSAEKMAKMKNDFKITSNNIQDPMISQNEDCDIDVDIITTNKSNSKLVKENIIKKNVQDIIENISQATLPSEEENKSKQKEVIPAKEIKRKSEEKMGKMKNDFKITSNNIQDPMISQNEDCDIDVDIITTNKSNSKLVEENIIKKKIQDIIENISQATLLSEEENKSKQKEVIPAKEIKRKSAEKMGKMKNDFKITSNNIQDPMMSQNEDCDIDVDIITTNKSNSKLVEENIIKKNVQDIIENISQATLLSEEENKSKQKEVIPAKEIKRKSAEKMAKMKNDFKITSNNIQDPMISQNEDCDIDVDIITTNKSNSKLVEENIIKKNVQDIIENISQATLPSEEENKSKQKEVIPAKEIKRKSEEKMGKMKNDFKITSNNLQDPMISQNEDCDIDVDIITTNKSNSKLVKENIIKKKIQDIIENISQATLLSEEENKSKQKEVIPAKEIKRKSAEKMGKMKNDFKITSNNIQDPMMSQNEDCDIDVDIITTNKSNSKLVKENIIKKNVQDIIENINQATLSSEENRLKEIGVITAKEIKRKSSEKMAKMKNDYKITSNNTQDPMMSQNEDCDIDVIINQIDKSNSKLVEENIIKEKDSQDFIENINQVHLLSEEENRLKEIGVITTKEIKQKSTEKMVKMKNDCKISPNNTQGKMIPSVEDCDEDIIINSTKDKNAMEESSSVHNDDDGENVGRLNEVETAAEGVDQNEEIKATTAMKNKPNTLDNKAGRRIEVGNFREYNQDACPQIEQDKQSAVEVIQLKDNNVDVGYVVQSLVETNLAASPVAIENLEKGRVIIGREENNVQRYEIKAGEANYEQYLRKESQATSAVTEEDAGEEDEVMNECQSDGCRRYKAIRFKATGCLDYIDKNRHYCGDGERKRKQPGANRDSLVQGEVRLKGTISDDSYGYSAKRKKIRRFGKNRRELKWKTILTPDYKPQFKNAAADGDTVDQDREVNVTAVEESSSREKMAAEADKSNKDVIDEEWINHEHVVGKEDQATSVTEEEWDEETEVMNESWKHDDNKSSDILYFKARGSLNYTNNDRNYHKDGKRTIKGPAGGKGGSLGQGGMGFTGDTNDEDYCHYAMRQNRSSRNKLMELKWEMNLAAETKPRLKKDGNDGESTNGESKNGEANSGISSVVHSEDVNDFQTQQELDHTVNTVRTTSIERNVSSTVGNVGATDVQGAITAMPLSNNREICKGLVVPIISGFTYLLRDTPPLSRQQKRRIRGKQTQLKLRRIKDVEEETRLEETKIKATKISGHEDEAGIEDKQNQDGVRCTFGGIEAKVGDLFIVAN